MLGPMPGTDLAIDPVTRDFVDDGAGDWLDDATIAPQVRHQVLDKLGLWWADRFAGCAAYAIPAKANRRTFLLYEDAYRDALSVFIESGLAEDLSIEVFEDRPGRLDYEASIVDVQHGELALTPLLTFGLEP